MLKEGMRIKTGEILEDQEAIHRFQWRMARLNFFRNSNIFSSTSSPERTNGSPFNEDDISEWMAEIVEGRVRRVPREREARRYLVEQLISRGYTRREISKRLGISRKTVYNLLKKP
jgi:putative transposase